MAAMYARFFAAAFRPSAAARTPARAFFLSFSAARLFKSTAARQAVVQCLSSSPLSIVTNP